MFSSVTRRALTSGSPASRRFLSTLLVAEHDGAKLADSTLAAVTACAALGKTTLLVGGSSAKAAAEAAAQVAGVDAVAVIESPTLDNGLAEEWTPTVLAMQKAGGFTHVVAGASAFSKGLLPRVAALLDVAQISDVLEIKDDSTFLRPTYAGNALATVKSIDPIKVMTVRPTSFDKAATSGGSAEVSSVSAEEAAGLVQFVRAEMIESDRPELASAGTVVAGGRGMGSADNFKLLDSLAGKLNAAVGASRAAVDAGMCPNDMQVGQTGKVVAPDLYVAVGISGAIQHLAGMKDSKTIVAINKDEDAPIFQVADYGLVDDLFKALPDLEKKI